jgi:hypothetical protein
VRISGLRESDAQKSPRVRSFNGAEFKLCFVDGQHPEIVYGRSTTDEGQKNNVREERFNVQE